MWYFVIIVICALVATVSCDTVKYLPKPRPDGRIVGGYEINIEDIPFQVSVQLTRKHICGGSIISERYILTAAHCTSGSSANKFRVRTGSSYHAREGNYVKVKKITEHPEYDGDMVDYDFSILELDKPIKFNSKSNATKLPEQDEEVEDGTFLMVSGWGDTQNANESKTKLRAVVVPKVSQEVCNTAYSMYGGITERMICAGFDQGGQDACQGDSGGPLTYGNVLVGVVSWEYGCALKGYPGVYSRVASVRDWIKSITNI